MAARRRQCREIEGRARAAIDCAPYEAHEQSCPVSDLRLPGGAGGAEACGGEARCERSVAGADVPRVPAAVDRTRAVERAREYHRCASEPSGHVVCGSRFRRRVEDDQRGHDVDADFPERGELFDRRCGAGSARPERDLGGNGRAQRAAQRGLRRRRVPLRRWRAHVEEHGAAAVGQHRADRDRPAGFQRGVRGGARAAVVAGRGARAVQDHGWGADVDADPEDQREHGRDGCGDRPVQSGRAAGSGASAAAACLDADPRRARIGAVQVERRRQDVAEDHDGAAGRRAGADRAGVFARAKGARVRGGGGDPRGDGHVPFARFGRELGAAIEPGGAAHVLRARVRRSAAGRARIHDGRDRARVR